MLHQQEPTATLVDPINGQERKVADEPLSTLSVTTPWHACRDPAVLRRLLLARALATQRIRSRLVRTRRPMGNNESPRVDGVDPQHAHNGHPVFAQQWDTMDQSGRNHQLEHGQPLVSHHDFSSRFRER